MKDMRRIEYYIYLVLSKFFGNKYIVKYYRKKGMVIGNNTHVFSRIVSSEPYLITIGDNCTISTNVSLLTHDASIGAIADRLKYSDLCGKITIGNNCFIGDRAIIMYGVTIGNNVIVAAGSIVTKSINKNNVIVAGVPAKIVGNVNEYKEKYESYFYSFHGLNQEQRKAMIMSHPEKLIKK